MAAELSMSAEDSTGVLVPHFAGMIPPTLPVTTGTSELDMRAIAVSQGRALQLEERLRGIGRFRATYLPGGKPLPAPDMESWIWEAARAQGEITWWLQDFPFDQLTRNDKGELILPEYLARQLPNPNVLPPREWGARELPRFDVKSVHYLQWAAGRSSVRTEQVQRDGVLDQLRQLAIRLTELCFYWIDDPTEPFPQRVTWGNARAVNFILTGYVPLIRPEQIPLPAGRGVRPQSPKHLQLGVFALQHRGESVKQRIDSWNRAYPEWSYTRDTAFTRDNSQAIKRLLSFPSGVVFDWERELSAVPNAALSDEEAEFERLYQETLRAVWQSDKPTKGPSNDGKGD